jgi:signal transduction histidine kinase/DNA-binding NarL/FixJ family response regulator
MIGIHYLDVWPREDRPVVEAAFVKALQGRQTEFEAKYLRPDGETITWQVVLSPVLDCHGQARRVVEIATDITVQKRAEDELLHAKAELQQYTAVLESSNHTLEEFSHIAEAANRAKSEFLTNMSHEIRTPMTAILGYADLMLEENIGRATREHVEVIKHNGKHLMGLINDILDLSKVEAGKMPIELIRCSPCELAAEVALLMRIRADAKHLKLETELAGPLPETVLTDPLRLRQVLVNLVGNAIKFTDQGEVRLAVRLTSDGGPPRLRFDVTDTGIGMNEEQVGRLFRAFSQVDNSSIRKFGGTGLGLCISKRLTEALGGDIEVRSEPGKGSTFSVIIDPGPLDGIRMIQNAQEALLDCPPTTTAATPDKLALHTRILLAEDKLDNQQLICLLLRKAGADVLEVENGQLAVEQASAAWEYGDPFDIILMDMQMPVMDGFTATRKLRELGYTGPIIALTAYAMDLDRQKCLDAGCDDYATKPIDRQNLLAMVARWAGCGRTHNDSSAFSTAESNTSTTIPRDVAALCLLQSNNDITV